MNYKPDRQLAIVHPNDAPDLKKALRDAGVVLTDRDPADDGPEVGLIRLFQKYPEGMPRDGFLPALVL